MDENPYQSPLAPGAIEGSLVDRGRILLHIVAASMFGVYTLVGAFFVLRGQMSLVGLTISAGIVAGVCYWLSRGSSVAKWIVVVVLLLQLPVVVVVVLLGRGDIDTFGFVLMESAIRVMFASTLVFSKSINAYLAFRPPQRDGRFGQDE